MGTPGYRRDDRQVALQGNFDKPLVIAQLNLIALVKRTKDILRPAGIDQNAGSLVEGSQGHFGMGGDRPRPLRQPGRRRRRLPHLRMHQPIDDPLSAKAPHPVVDHHEHIWRTQAAVVGADQHHLPRWYLLPPLGLNVKVVLV